jgi:hypothetical protein
MTAFSASDAALEGFRLTRERPGTILAWGVIYALGVFLIGRLMLLLLDPQLIGLVSKRDLSPDDMEAISGLLAHSWPAFLLVLAAVLVFTAVFQAGIYRLVLRPAETGFLHLRFGLDELRLALVNLVMVVLGVICLFVEFVSLGLAEQGGGLVAIAAAAAVLVFTIWLGVRLSLATPATFAARKVDIAGGWRLTRGMVFWPLLGMIVLAIIFYIMVFFLIGIIGAALVAIAGGPEAIAHPGDLGPAGWIALALYFGLELILQIVQLVMISSPLAVAYQQIDAALPVEAG